MFLIKDKVACKDFVTLPDKAARLIISVFENSSSAEELNINKRDVTMYKLSIKKYLSDLQK